MKSEIMKSGPVRSAAWQRHLRLFTISLAEMSSHQRSLVLAVSAAALIWLYRRRKQSSTPMQASTLFTATQLETLNALADTIVPRDEVMAKKCGDNVALRDFYLRKASDLNVATLICDALMNMNEEVISEFKLLITALDSSLGTFLLTGNWGRFASLSSQVREQALISWSNSRFVTFRKAFIGIRKLAASFFLLALPDGAQNPNWGAIGYPGPPPRTGSTKKTFQPLTITAPTELEFDAVVIGSGAGGGVCVGELARHGFRVLVVEKGGYFEGADFCHTELNSYNNLYERGALLTTEDGSMSALAGSCFGGGTTVNWSASLPTPLGVRQEWASKFGLKEVTSAMWEQANEAVCQRASVGQVPFQHNANNASLAKGADACGIGQKDILRNCANCENEQYCGYCQFGCAWGGKQTVAATYMRDALSAPHPVQILVRAHADRIIFDPKTKKAVGVLTSVLNETQQQHHLVKINAKVVVTACGSVHTPALLLRSGLKNPNIGKHLRLHPVSGLFAEFSDPMQCYLGPMMTKLVDKFADMDGQGYGIRIEMAPVHPGLAASSVPWSGGSDFKTLLARGAYTASMIVLTRDKDSGHVSMDAKSGQPRLHYSISPLDSAHMIRGLEIGARIFRAAGALRVGTTQQGVAPFVLGKHKAGSKEEDAEFDRFLQSIRAAGTQPFTAGLFSAHQMGSCRMGGSSSYSVFDSHGECWEASNLFVTDASAFPTASGVNPMITTQTLAYYVAHNFICPRLQMLCSGNGPVTSKNDSTARKTSNL